MRPYLRLVAPDGMRPGGWTDGYAWRDPSPHQDPLALSVAGVRTRPEPCPTCRTAVREHEDGVDVCRCGTRRRETSIPQELSP